MQIWTGVLLAIFCVALVAFAFVSRKPLCIDSRIVEKIDSISEAGSAQAYRCNARRHVSFDQELADVSKALGPRLQKLESFLEFVGPLKERVSVTMLETSEAVFKVHGHHIFLNQKEAQNPGLLEKAILMSWFRERANESLFLEPLIEETITDLMVSSLLGQLHIKETESNFMLSEDSMARWPLSLQTWKSYCQSPWRLMTHLSTCKDPEKLTLKESALSSASLRPLLTQTWIQSFQKLTALEKIVYLKSLSQNLDGLVYVQEAPPLQPEAFEYLDFEESVIAVKSWLKFLHGVDEKSKLSLEPLASRELQNRGFSADQATANRLSLIVLDQSKSPNIKAMFFEALRKNPTLAAWESKELVSFIEYQDIPRKALRDLQARKIVLLTCGAVTFEQVLKLADRTQSLVVVETCGENAVVQFDQFLRKGILGFASQNQELPFIEFHLPSLKMALHKLTNAKTIIASEIKMEKPETFAFLPKSRSEFDDKLNVYRLESAIEAIPYYRPRTVGN